MESCPTVLYFGPLKESGHFMFYDTGYKVPWSEGDITPWPCDSIDGTVQPGAVMVGDRLVQRGSWKYGEAVIRQKDGWTLLSFWDSTVDTRPGSSSTYLAEGIFTFEQMVELAKERFPERWAIMKFPVVDATERKP